MPSAALAIVSDSNTRIFDNPFVELPRRADAAHHPTARAEANRHSAEAVWQITDTSLSSVENGNRKEAPVLFMQFAPYANSG